MFSIADEEDVDEEIETVMVKSASKQSLSLFTLEDEEEENEDTAAEYFAEASAIAKVDESPIFLEAKSAVEGPVLCWDNAIWVAYITEVEEGRGGSISLSDAYVKFLVQFPRAVRVWIALCKHFISNENVDAAEQTFQQCLYNCRSVALWKLYIEFIQSKTIDKCPSDSENFAEACVACKDVYVAALDHVGCSVDALILWQMYIKFTTDVLLPYNSSLNKFSVLGDIYTQCVVIPLVDGNTLWRDFSLMLKSDTSKTFECEIEEYEKKHEVAKAVCSERETFIRKLHRDRLAVPPTHALVEIEQLQCWNNLFRYELGGQSEMLARLPTSQRDAFIFCMLDQFTACFAHHPEVWLMYGKFANQSSASPSTKNTLTGIELTRFVFAQGIRLLPDCAFLRFAFAEFEEMYGTADNARDIYRTAYESNPSLLSFSAYQRFIRRHDGIADARKLFRMSVVDSTVGYRGPEMYLLHAKLEWEANGSVDVAWRVLESGQKAFPNSAVFYSIAFIRLMCTLLLKKGEIGQMRWCLHHALECLHPPYTEDQLHGSVSGSVNETVGAQSALPVVLTNTATTSDSTAILQLQIWEEYLLMETLLCSSDLKRLNDIRQCRNISKLTVAGKQLSVMSSVQETAGAEKNARSSVVECCMYKLSSDLCQRYCNWSGADASLLLPSTVTIKPQDVTVPAAPKCKDEAWRMRSGGESFIEDVRAVTMRLRAAARADRDRKLSRKSNEFESTSALNGSAYTDESFNASGLPTYMRDMVMKLSQTHSTIVAPTSLEVDALLDQLKRVILPPRPPQETTTALDEGANLKMEQNVQVLPAATVDVEDDVDASYERVEGDNIFRRRQRQRLMDKGDVANVMILE